MPGNIIPCFHLLATLRQNREISPELDYIIRLIGATEPWPCIHITIVVVQGNNYLSALISCQTIICLSL